MFERVLRGGRVVDGSGAPARVADVALDGGRIAAVGESLGPARESVDVSGRIVCPGFVDLHTHFDAQVFWDPQLSPAPLHGVTSVVGGNCGFSIAPLAPEAGDYLMRMLARVEGMPLESLAEGVPWDWSSFGDYLARIEARGVAVNAGFLVGHSALRRVVMGSAAVGEEASPQQLAAMQELLARSLAEGGLGFSSSWAQTHNDGDGKPVPSRFASREELLALASVLREHPGTALEFLPGVARFDEERMDLMASLSLAAERPLNWNVLGVSSFSKGHEHQLSASDYAAQRGATVVALTPSQNMTLRLNLVSGSIFDAFPEWPEVIALPLEERKRALADPTLRRRLEEGARSERAGALRAIAVWENMTIAETCDPRNGGLAGRRLGDVAAERGQSAFDAMLDIALVDDLRTSFSPFIPGDDAESWELRARVWRDPRTLIGASDAGAHLDMIDTFTCTTSLLGPAVRERGLLGLEEAVHQLTELPARLYGLRDRGRLLPGWWADLVVFDPARIGPREVHTRHDLPGGAGRLYAEADGIDAVWVNGQPVVQDGALTGALPGRVLRSGRDTETVGIPARGGVADEKGVA